MTPTSFQPHASPATKDSECENPIRNLVLVNNDKLSIDLAVLASLRDFQQAGEADFVTELIDLYLSDTASHLELVRAAAAVNDVNELRRLAHLLKGSSGTIGANRMAKLYGALEKNEPPNGAAGSLFLEIENEFEQVSRILNAERRAIKQLNLARVDK